MFEFALQQLRYLAGQCGEDGIRPSPVTGVFESDQALDTDLRQDLLAALKPLEDVPDGQKDWHPGSDQQVLDLVHPSLFPLVYGLLLRTTAPCPEEQAPTSPVAMEPAEADSATPAADDATANAAAPAGPASCSTRDGEGQGDRSVPAACENAASPRHSTDEAHAAEDEMVGAEADAVLQLEDSVETRNAICKAVAAATTWHTANFQEWKTKMGSGTAVAGAPRRDRYVSDKFQWLPADVLVSADGRIVFDSYVNNMHPERHAALYAATARLLERMLPLFARTLTASTRRPQRVAEVPPHKQWWDPVDTEGMWEKLKADGEAGTFVQEANAAHA
eukprot:jgi/Ulvmu1/2312/UM013_0160.1